MAFVIAMRASDDFRVFYINEPDSVTPQIALEEYVKLIFKDLNLDIEV